MIMQRSDTNFTDSTKTKRNTACSSSEYAFNRKSKTTSNAQHGKFLSKQKHHGKYIRKIPQAVAVTQPYTKQAHEKRKSNKDI